VHFFAEAILFKTDEVDRKIFPATKSRVEDEAPEKVGKYFAAKNPGVQRSVHI
jgi:hypothetical protein